MVQAFKPLCSRIISEVKIGNIGKEHGVNASSMPKPKNNKTPYQSECSINLADQIWSCAIWGAAASALFSELVGSSKGS
ncbi:Uncharacterised protein [Acinetobacter baumannii]|nr:Uncharacterised protein [Acinetobacter baumannii]